MNKLKEGISLRKIHNWLIVIAVIVSAFMIYSTYRLTNNFMHVRDALNENIALESAIENMEAVLSNSGRLEEQEHAVYGQIYIDLVDNISDWTAIAGPETAIAYAPISVRYCHPSC